MYAKLNFNTDIPAAAIRDIARLIDASDGAGGANNASYEYLDLATSVIEDTVPSGWSLTAQTPLRIGDVVAGDGVYHFQSPHSQAGKNKYMALRVAGSYTITRSSLSTDNTIMMAPISDYDLPTQRIMGGSQWDSGFVSYVSYGKVCLAANSTIEIIATEKMFVMIGTSKLYNSRLFFMLLESPPTVGTQIKQTAPMVFLAGFCGNFDYPLTDALLNNRGYIWDYGTEESSFWARTVYDTSIQFLVDLVYNPIDDIVYKVVVTNCEPDDAVEGTSADEYNTSNFLTGWTLVGISDNGLINENMQFTSDDIQSFNSFRPHDLMPTTIKGLKTPAFGNQRDANGNSVLPLVPLKIRQGTWDLNEIRISRPECPVYMTYGGFGAVGDTLTVGSDEYYYLPIGWGGTSYGAYLIKKN